MTASGTYEPVPAILTHVTAEELDPTLEPLSFRARRQCVGAPGVRERAAPRASSARTTSPQCGRSVAHPRAEQQELRGTELRGRRVLNGSGVAAPPQGRPALRSGLGADGDARARDRRRAPGGCARHGRAAGRHLPFADWVTIVASDEKPITTLLHRLAHHAAVITTKRMTQACHRSRPNWKARAIRPGASNARPDSLRDPPLLEPGLMATGMGRVATAQEASAGDLLLEDGDVLGAGVASDGGGDLGLGGQRPRGSRCRANGWGSRWPATRSRRIRRPGRFLTCRALTRITWNPLASRLSKTGIP